MSVFHYEIASAHSAVARANPGSAEGIYAVPWYLVLGDPGSGRSTALHVMNLTWNNGEGPLELRVPDQRCTYWMPQEAVFIEPEATVLGPNRQPDALKELCEELRKSRPREHLDGILLLINVGAFIDLDERGIESYANGLRRYLVEVAQALYTDVPVYVTITGYDRLWGFAEVFAWGPDRTREDPWGFTLALDTAPQDALARVKQELVGLNARLEAFCLAKLSSDDNAEQRIRAFQHLAEVRAFMEKLNQVFNTVAMANSFERAPWIRAVALGSAVPGTGDRLRAGMTRFTNMGFMQQSPPANIGGPRAGGLPIHAFMKTVILPERDIVPLRTRWRDDKPVLICFALGVFLWIGGLVAAVVFSTTTDPGKTPPAATAKPR
jgi:type VI protein secretion system component VasK